MFIDMGPQFNARMFKDIYNRHGIKVLFSGIESYNSLGVGERYHSYLRNIYHKVKA